MSALTKDFLESIGISLDDATFEAFANHFDTSLKERILSDIIDDLDDDQLAELEQMKNTDGDQLWHWVQANVTDLNEIIQDEVDILLGELAENADHI
jgi:hypothetical protein